MALEYQTVLDAYQKLFPDAQARLSAEGGGDEFNRWWGQMEQNQVTPEMLGALVRLIESKPDQRESFLRQGGDVKGFIDRTVDFWAGQGGHAAGQNLNQFKPEMELIDAAGYEINPAVKPTLDPQGTVGMEQFLGEHFVNNILLPGLERDKINQATTAGIVTDINRDIDAAIAANREVTEGRMNTDLYLQQNPDVMAWAKEMVATGALPDLAAAAKQHYATNGKNEGRAASFITRLDDENAQTVKTVRELTGSAETAAASRLAALDERKAEMTTALERMAGDRSGALDAEIAKLREGLGVLETERRAALKGLADARINAANAEVTGINQALEGERDRIASRTAAQGFIGGSTMEDTALARAAIGARTDAARTMGGARVTNATETRDLGNEIANARYGITGREATEGRGIKDQLATGRFSLADALSQGRVGIAETKAGDIQTAENLGTSQRGNYFDQDFTRRMQAAINPINLNKSRLELTGLADEAGTKNYKDSLGILQWFANGSPPPTFTPTTVTPSQSGAGLGALGAGVAGAGFSLLNAYANNKAKPGGAVTPNTPVVTPTAAGAMPLLTPPPPTAANTNRYLTPGLS